MIANITTPIALGQATANYVIRDATGFGSGGVEVVKWNRPGFHGIKTPRSFWRERIMRLIIGVRADTSTAYETKRRDLQAAFDLPRDGLTTFKFVTQGGLELQCDVQLNAQIQSPLRAGEVTIGEFRIELIAEDPLFYSQTEDTDDITFVSGSGVVSNDGNAPVYPIIRIHGNVTDPVITNTTINKTVSFSGLAIGAGEYVDVDMLNETAVDQLGDSVFDTIDSDDFWTLAEGSNTITISGTLGGSGDRKITVIYRDGYIGI
ncbi:MAG: phage tail family protein [Candidatus Peribacteraceae bacterium]|nr:phage tail family protein [Candidatus Peribacteraceae bacterium]